MKSTRNIIKTKKIDPSPINYSVQGEAIKYYFLDICSNPRRIDSWSAMALARGSQLEMKLNSVSTLPLKTFAYLGKLLLEMGTSLFGASIFLFSLLQKWGRNKKSQLRCVRSQGLTSQLYSYTYIWACASSAQCAVQHGIWDESVFPAHLSNSKKWTYPLLAQRCSNKHQHHPIILQIKYNRRLSFYFRR